MISADREDATTPQMEHRNSWPEVKGTDVRKGHSPRFAENKEPGNARQEELRAYLSSGRAAGCSHEGSVRSGGSYSSVAPEFDDRRLMGRYLESKQQFHGVNAMEKYTSAVQNIDRQAVHERMAREIANTGKKYHSALDKLQRQDPLAHTTVCVRKGGTGPRGSIEEKISTRGTLKYTQDSGEALTAMDHQVGCWDRFPCFVHFCRQGTCQMQTGVIRV